MNGVVVKVRLMTSLRVATIFSYHIRILMGMLVIMNDGLNLRVISTLKYTV